MKDIFKVGDEVWCMLYGKGKVDILDNSLGTNPVGVEFESDYYGFYTPDGRLRLELPPTLGFTEVEMPKPNQVRPVWRAEKGEVYWYINEFGGTHHALESLSAEDAFRFKAGNYFKSMEQAKESKLYLSYIREEE